MKVRLIGLSLMLLSGVAIHLLYGLYQQVAQQQATATELLLAVTIVVTGLGGVLMAAVGPDLLHSPDD